MELISSSVSLPSPCFGFSRRTTTPHLLIQPRTVRYRPASSSKDSFDFGGGLVDENMIVLRMRIHQMQVAEEEEEEEEDVLSSDCAKYKAEVCAFVGLIQTLLLNNRPSVAIGAVVLVALSVPTSAVLVTHHLMEMAKLAVHLG